MSTNNYIRASPAVPNKLNKEGGEPQSCCQQSKSVAGTTQYQLAPPFRQDNFGGLVPPRHYKI
jgi:hypothetical protein